MVSIAVMSFLVGTMFNMNSIATAGKKPNRWDEVWTAISELQSMVSSLNTSIAELSSRAVEVLTIYDGTHITLIGDMNWHDTIDITITLQKNASVLAIGTTMLSSVPNSGIHLGFRTVELGFADRIGRRHWANGVVTIHRTWSNRATGNYTLALGYQTTLFDDATASFTRLTLVIIY